MIRRPRSVALPMLLTTITLVGLMFRVARFHEHFTITITKPSATDPPRALHVNQTIDVEGFIDAGDAVYTTVDLIFVRLIHKDPTAPGAKVCYGADGYFGPHDPAIYTTVDSIFVRLIHKDPTVPGAKVCYGADGYFGPHDPAIKRFSAYVRVIPTGPESLLYLDIDVIDKAGRTHGSGHERVPTGNQVPIRVQPTTLRR